MRLHCVSRGLLRKTATPSRRDLVKRMRLFVRMFLIAIFFASLNIGLARCEEPVALVEEVSPNIHGVSAYDYVSVGSQIDLGTEGRITLGYLAACAEETIQGG